MATLLQIVRAAQGELGLTQSTVVATSQDPTTIQWYNLVNREGKNLQKMDWTFLQKLCSITPTAPTETTGNTTEDAYTITGIPSTSALAASTFVVSGSSIISYARIVSVDSATQVTIDMPATATSTAVALTFAKDTYAFPSDFDRFINRTFWDRTNRWEVLGPDSPQIDEFHRSGIVVTGPRRHFRQVGPKPTALRLWPPPGADDPLFTTAFEYMTTNWAVDSDGVGISSMTEDTDTPLVDSDAIIMGIKWRWLQAKQLNYAAQQVEYNDWVRVLQAQDGGAKTLSMARQFSPYLISSAQVQDGSFPDS